MKKNPRHLTFNLAAGALAGLFALPSSAGAFTELEARGYAEATTVGTFDDHVLTPATGTDSVTSTESIADSHIPGLSGTSTVTGTAAFGAISGSGTTTATGQTALSYFQAQPVGRTYDFITVFGSAPLNLTLHYEFDASVTVPSNQPGTVIGYVRGTVSFFPSGFTDNSQNMTDDNIYVSGNSSTSSNEVVVADSSHGASESLSGSSTVQVNPGATYGLFGSLELFGEAQNLNGDGREIAVSTAGSLTYWVTFDSSDAYLVSASGATYGAPSAAPGTVPETPSTVALLGLALGGLGVARRTLPRATVGA